MNVNGSLIRIDEDGVCHAYSEIGSIAYPNEAIELLATSFILPEIDFTSGILNFPIGSCISGANSVKEKNKSILEE